MRRKSRFFSNQLVTLGILMCLLGVSLEVSTFASPPFQGVGGCPPQCPWQDANGFCGSDPPPDCGNMNNYCRGNPNLFVCNQCLCVSQPGEDPDDCFCWK